MKKKQLLWILFGILLVAVPCMVYFLQPSPPQPVEFPLTLTMTQIDQEGNATRNWQMFIEGEKGESPSGIPYLYARISSFDGIKNIETINNLDSNLPEIVTYPGVDPCAVTCLGFEAGMPAAVNLAFSPDLQRWLFYNIADETYFVGSVNNKFTTQELYSYFSPIITGSWSPN
ncbi:MAG: hypothetical protein E7470_02680 [Ruminococcaceae bacterium]|nr:hypothetical protein [Oscillospiraceae bacterium]